MGKSCEKKLAENFVWAKSFLARTDSKFNFKWDVYFHKLQEITKFSRVWIDAGCGDYRAVAEYESTGIKIGVDLEFPDTLVRDSKAIFCRADLLCLPFKSASVAVITCRQVFEHLREPYGVICEFARVLEPGGKLLVQTTNRWHPVLFLGSLIPLGLKKRALSALFGVKKDSVQKTYHRFNSPRKFKKHIAELKRKELVFIEDIALLSKLFVIFSFIYHSLTKAGGLAKFRSSITALYEK